MPQPIKKLTTYKTESNSIAITKVNKEPEFTTPNLTETDEEKFMIKV